MPRKAVKKKEEEIIEEPVYDEGGSGVLGLLIVVVLILILGGAGYGYWRISQNNNQNSEVLGEQEQTTYNDEELGDAQNLVSIVGKHVLLPSGEPTIAIIEDVDALKESQAFFTNASNGDRLLIYPELAVIYNPANNIVVNMGPVFRDEEIAEENEETTMALNIEVRNGSGVAGEAKKVGNALDAQEAYSVVRMADAVRTNYSNTIVVNLSGKDVSALASELGAEIVAELPAGEKATNADVVVIIGQK
jgi:hypothetical protein